MKNHCQLARLASLVVLSLVVVVATTTPSSATGNIVKADLSGAWQMTIIGQTGCGFGTTLYTFTLNASGSSSNVTGIYHTAGCGDGTSSGNMFTIQSLHADGSGTANLTCGTGCGWNLNIQVSPDRLEVQRDRCVPRKPGKLHRGRRHPSVLTLPPGSHGLPAFKRAGAPFLARCLREKWRRCRDGKMLGKCNGTDTFSP
jgi:hypothetical protein